jgi:hypothetical protein
LIIKESFNIFWKNSANALLIRAAFIKKMI